MRRKEKGYFKTESGSPAPVTVEVSKRVSFSEVDAMAIVWHGRYAQFFEMAAEALGRKTGLSYQAYRENDLRAPIVQHHIDYHKMVELEEEITIRASLVWTEAARLNTEFTVIKENGQTAATGYTVQMFLDAKTNRPYMLCPQLIEDCRKRWLSGEFDVRA